VNANQLISEYALSYDDGANVITLNETQQVGGAPQRETQRFTFGGAMNRLSRAEYGNYQVNYSYNTAGNRVSETATGAVSSSRNYTYGVLGRLTQVTETAAETTTTGFEYDANGNLTRKTVTPQSGICRHFNVMFHGKGCG
jgi:YD repeat-containing protein